MRSLVILLLAGAAMAQTNGSVEGVVRDQTAGAVRDASVRLRETGTDARRETVTDAEGRFQLLELAPGNYQAEVAHAGFREQTRAELGVSAGQVLRVEFVLELGQTSARIEVSSEATLISTSTADWGGTLAHAELDALPLNGRDMFALAAQQPGVALPATTKHDVLNGLGMKAAVQGARPSQNSFQLDGVHLNDASGAAPAGAAGLLIGIESVRELRIVSSPFSAEYGRAAGAVFTAVSKSGSNEFHGSLYEFLRNSALDARNYFDAAGQDIPPLRRNQFGGLLGGPLRRDRIFFLANFESLRESLGQTLRPAVPNAAVREQAKAAVRPYVDLYPLPNGRDFGDGTGEYIGSVVRRTDESYATWKTDVLFSPAVRAATRYTWDSSDRSAPDAISLWRFYTHTRHHFLNAELQHVVSAHTIHTVRAAFSRIWNGDLAAAERDFPAGLGFVPGYGLGSIQVTGLADLGGSSLRQRPRRHVFNDYQVKDELVQIRGDHTLRLGAGLDRIQFNQVADQSAMGHYQFNSLQSFLLGQPQSAELMMAGSDAARGWRQIQYFGYVQDEWRAASRLHFSLGLRYEAYTTPGEVNGKTATLPNPATDKAITLGGAVFDNPSSTNFAPRAALAWDPKGNGKTVVRAGGGIYFDLIGTPQLIIAGVRMPPYYNRVALTRPEFPDLLHAVESVTALNSMDGLDYDLKQPYTAQFQFAVERQLSPAVAVRAGYAGGRGVHLISVIGNVNPTRPQVEADGRLYFPAGTPRVNPAFDQIGMRRSQFDSFYHGFNAGLERRWSRGLRLEANYTWSKSIDDSSSNVFSDFGGSEQVSTMFNYRQNRGLSDFDVRHVLNANLSYQYRGWEAHLLGRVQTGQPFAPTVGFDRARLLAGRTDLGQRPDYSATAGSQVILGAPQQYFDPLAFTLPAAGYYGNLGRGTLTAPGLCNLDVALHRILWSRERQSLRLRAEVFNAANRPNFLNPDGLALFDSTGKRLATAGRITGTSTTSRQVQVALKWQF